jgi:hypothetical protein
VVSGSSGKLPTTNDDLNPEMLKNEEYHNQVKPVLNALRFIGMLPLETPSDGKLDGYSIALYFNINTRRSDSYINFLKNKGSKRTATFVLASFPSFLGDAI